MRKGHEKSLYREETIITKKQIDSRTVWLMVIDVIVSGDIF